MTDIPELTNGQLARAIPGRLRKRLMQGRFDSGADIAALRAFVGMTQAEFALAIGISVHTLRNWEQGRRKPEGPRSPFCASPRDIRRSCDRISGSRGRFRSDDGRSVNPPPGMARRERHHPP